MQHNHDWHISANGDKYARRLPTQPDERHYLYGPGTGKSDRSSRRTDRIFDGLTTIILLAVGIAEKSIACPDAGRTETVPLLVGCWLATCRSCCAFCVFCMQFDGNAKPCPQVGLPVGKVTSGNRNRCRSAPCGALGSLAAGAGR